MLIATEIVDVKDCTPWKLISYAGLAPSTRDWKNIKARFSLAEMDIGSICNDCSKI
jgi:hypothetical protein